MDKEKKHETSALKSAIANLENLVNNSKFPTGYTNIVEITIGIMLGDFPEEQKQWVAFVKPLLNDNGEFISPAHQKQLKDALAHWHQSGELMIPLSKDADLPPPLEDIPPLKILPASVLDAKQKLKKRMQELTQPIALNVATPTKKELGIIIDTFGAAHENFRWIPRYVGANSASEEYDRKSQPQRMASYKKTFAEVATREAKSPVYIAKKLYYAARKGQLEKVKMLIAQGAPVNEEIQLGKSEAQQRPLSGAAYCTDAKTRHEIIKLLLDAGAIPRFSSQYRNLIPDVLVIIGAPQRTDISTAKAIKLINDWLIAHPIPAPVIHKYSPLSLGRAGDPHAQYQEGVRYEAGLGVPKDLEKAVRCYKRAVAHGHPDAQCALGYCYERGLGGLPQDLTKAFTMYQLAAAQGIAQAQYYLGVCYAQGLGVETTLAKAVHCYTLAAAQGHAQAKYSLEVCYALGLGIASDEKKAKKHFSAGFWQPKQDPAASLTRLKPGGQDTAIEPTENISPTNSIR